MLKNISKALIAMFIVTILPVGVFGVERVSHRNPDNRLDIWFTDTSGNILNGWVYNDSTDSSKGGTIMKMVDIIIYINGFNQEQIGIL